jgi:RimJ/RimL family protein N-acetyltransferase
MVEWDGTVVLTTSRLRLRTFRRDDLPLYAAMNADPEVVEFLGGQPLSRDESDAIADATEAAAAWLRHGFTALDLPRVISITDRDPPNRRSIAVMRRLGMVLDHEADLVDETGASFAAVVYGISAAQWRAGPGRTADRPR